MSVVMNSVRSNRLISHIQSEIDENRLVLPTLPDVAIRARDAINSGDASVDKIVSIVSSDAALSARLIQVANSPLYRGQVEIEKLPLAVSRLGLNTVKTLITSIVLKQLFKPQSSMVEDYFREIWQQSVNVSAISRALASRCPNLDPEQAMLAGLIHQIGKLPILMYAQDNPDLLSNNEEFADLLEQLHPNIGMIIMTAWKFPESLSSVVAEYKDFRRISGSETEYVDVVQVAFLESIGGNLQSADDIDLNSVSAFAKLGLAADIEILDIEGVAEEVQEAQTLIN